MTLLRPLRAVVWFVAECVGALVASWMAWELGEWLA